MDRMRIAEQRKEVLIFATYLIFSYDCQNLTCFLYIDLKAIVRLMEEGFGERVWSFRAVKA